MSIGNGFRGINPQIPDDLQQFKLYLSAGFSQFEIPLFDKMPQQSAPPIMLDDNRSDSIQLGRSKKEEG